MKIDLSKHNGKTLNDLLKKDGKNLINKIFIRDGIDYVISELRQDEISMQYRIKFEGRYRKELELVFPF